MLGDLRRVFDTKTGSKRVQWACAFTPCVFAAATEAPTEIDHRHDHVRLGVLTLSHTPTYSATKAAIHAFTDALRYQLRETNVDVVEIAPPYVQTELMGDRQANGPQAMPLAEFIDEVMSILETQPDAREVLVKRVHPLRFAAEQGYEKYMAQFHAFNERYGAGLEG